MLPEWDVLSNLAFLLFVGEIFFLFCNEHFWSSIFLYNTKSGVLGFEFHVELHERDFWSLSFSVHSLHLLSLLNTYSLFLILSLSLLPYQFLLVPYNHRFYLLHFCIYEIRSLSTSLTSFFVILNWLFWSLTTHSLTLSIYLSIYLSICLTHTQPIFFYLN